MTSGPARPTAFVVLGPAGSGKSTVARAMTAHLRCAYLDKDLVTGPLVEALLAALGEDPLAREASQIYLDRVMPLEYQCLFNVAAANLRLGTDVVMDAPFAGFISDPEFMRRASAQARWPLADVVAVHVRTSELKVRRRLKERGLARDRAKLADWSAFWRAHGEQRCAWPEAFSIEFVNDGPLDGSALEAVIAAGRRTRRAD